ncbi:hypothetical protein PoB_007698000 [Plakobranchus ocellatus]|uniref:Uncharacterized protein n=1 Tax=Plakobranchus ocellatus TaxID=259542 RepID=A0AAV4E295_9GAST|nr:hypothetical protein PoB_007698000 [Plakobranchus ocellatus]
MQTTNITYKDHVTDEEVNRRIRRVIGPYTDRFTLEKHGKINIGAATPSVRQALRKPLGLSKILYRMDEEEADKEKDGGQYS